MEPLHREVPDRDVRAVLVRHYAQIAAQFAGSGHRSWRDRLAAVAEGETLVEPGWMLRAVVGDDVDVYGLYRVYPDGRIERDRVIEREHSRRFRGDDDRSSGSFG